MCSNCPDREAYLETHGSPERSPDKWRRARVRPIKRSTRAPMISIVTGAEVDLAFVNAETGAGRVIRHLPPAPPRRPVADTLQCLRRRAIRLNRNRYLHMRDALSMDDRIILELRSRGGTRAVDLARRLGLSTATVYRREEHLARQLRDITGLEAPS